MADKLYLLVCEGPTDIQMIDKISKRVSSDIGTPITVRALAPQRDRTHRYPSHGWEEVRKWCKLYGATDYSDENPFAKLAQKKNWQALVQASGAHGLIIQIDIDIAKFIVDLIPLVCGITKKERKTFCKKAILNWLGLSNLPGNVYFLLSSYATETWILATHLRTDPVFDDLEEAFDFETIDNVIERLIALHYRNYVDDSGKQRLVKDLNIYKHYADNVANHLDKVRHECKEVELFCSMLEH